MQKKREMKLHHALITFISFTFLIIVCVTKLGIDPQTPLIIGCAIGSIIAIWGGCTWRDVLDGIVDGIHSSIEAIIILLLIGMLVGTWIACGTVPAIIYYGLKIISAKFFLPAVFFVCAIVSLAIGSWGTIGTIGLGFMGVGIALKFPASMVVGAILSGAYVGEIFSPLADALNLNAAVVETDLMKLSKSVLVVLLPVIVIIASAFYVLGLPFSSGDATLVEQSIEPIISSLSTVFRISPAAFLPIIVLLLCILVKVPAIPAMFVGSAVGALYGFIFQSVSLKDMLQACYYGYVSSTGTELIDQLLTAGGMSKMLYSISIIIVAMGFGGMLNRTGQINALISPLMRGIRSNIGLVAVTEATCVFVNALMPDQYLAIALPGQTFKNTYAERKIPPEILGTILSSAATATSCLIPWNTCGTYIASILGVSALAYGKYYFLGILMPIGMFIYFLISYCKHK